VLDRVGDAVILAGLGLWALDGYDARGVPVLTVATTATTSRMGIGCC
jgi:hypothetical protein